MMFVGICPVWCDYHLGRHRIFHHGGRVGIYVLDWSLQDHFSHYQVEGGANDEVSDAQHEDDGPGGDWHATTVVTGNGTSSSKNFSAALDFLRA